ncbi:DUF4115 domain-containing protein [Desulfobotulus sp. H1]|uniref:DUF4115 domain-containing protein n=1 Tax=Desulfobotulus pelophilus TaxID=2823377 RepID=A0ABT3NB25_9BACT|nr:helix-turn-helix domain-containing protein [Desulfobotulus pelophilus]MCW7754662.1 DUF4115 domain-containing protein [Desulfobotulus pelophilus]
MGEESRTTEEGFGLYLQNGRIMQGILLQDLAERLFVSRETLQRLEDEDHGGLPVPVFVRGFVRHYAQEVNLDPDYAAELYKKARKKWDAREEDARRKILFRKRLVRWLKGCAVLLILIAALSFGGVWLAGFMGDVEARKEAALMAVARSTPDYDQPRKPVQSGYKLELLAVESTWVKIIVDEEPSRSFSVEPGDVLEFHAEKTYNVLIGSATGVRLRLNGKALPLSGSGGQAVNLHLP